MLITFKRLIIPKLLSLFESLRGFPPSRGPYFAILCQRDNFASRKSENLPPPTMLSSQPTTSELLDLKVGVDGALLKQQTCRTLSTLQI